MSLSFVQSTKIYDTKVGRRLCMPMCARRKSCGKSACLLGLARLPNIELDTSKGKLIEKNWGHVVISYINLFYTLFEPASMIW